MRTATALRLLATAVLLAPTILSAQRVETGFLDRTAKLGPHTYRYQVFVPSGYASSNQRWPVILFLHGAGERGADGLFQTQVGIATHIRRAPENYPAIVILPQVPKDSLWLGAPADAAIVALDQTLAEFRTDADRVYLTGMSMGGQGTWYLAYKHPARFAAIAPICGYLEHRFLPRERSIVPRDSGDAYAALARRLGRLPTWIFHGEVDPVVPVDGSRRAFEALKAAGGDVRYTELLGLRFAAISRLALCAATIEIASGGLVATALFDGTSVTPCVRSLV
jgi:predicted peptidase